MGQNQTYRHEISGGYLWSPKPNANKVRNLFYRTMREVSPGDIIFSFRDTRIAALGIACSYCYESPKPTEFGAADSYWETIGWEIDVSCLNLTWASVRFSCLRDRYPSCGYFVPDRKSPEPKEAA